MLILASSDPLLCQIFSSFFSFFHIVAVFPAAAAATTAVVVFEAFALFENQT